MAMGCVSSYVWASNALERCQCNIYENSKNDSGEVLDEIYF